VTISFQPHLQPGGGAQAPSTMTSSPVHLWEASPWTILTLSWAEWHPPPRKAYTPHVDVTLCGKKVSASKGPEHKLILGLTGLKFNGKRRAGKTQSTWGDGGQRCGTKLLQAIAHQHGLQPPHPGRMQDGLSPDFGLLTSRTVRELISIVLRHSICDTLLQQPQETGTSTHGLPVG
jgi:hypothetical protein